MVDMNRPASLVVSELSCAVLPILSLTILT